MKLPGFLSPLGLKLAGAAVLLVIIFGIAGGNQIFSPGALSAQSEPGVVRGEITSHSELSTNCAACHTAPWIELNMNDQCLNCHTEIQEALRDPTSLHGALKATDCRACHTEHRGPQGYLTDVDEQEIDHNQFGFSLAAHETAPDGRPFACTDCHTESLTQFEPTRCETCHSEEDARFTATHVQEFGTYCRACHEGTDVFSKDRFDHNQLAFPLLGKHAQVRCVDCHPGVTSLAAFKDAPTDCAGCHLQDNPHPPNFGTDCARCHNTEGWPTEIFDHDLAAFKLTGKHVQVECKQCHVNDVFRGTPTECVSCHIQDDVHRGQFGQDCAACHTTDTWQRPAFEHTFPLDHGGLGPIACVTCHTTPGNFEAYTCYNCHDPDDIVRQHAFAEMMNTNITDCARCHPTGESTMQMH